MKTSAGAPLLDLLGERRARRIGDRRLLAGLGLPGGVDVVERVLQAGRGEAPSRPRPRRPAPRAAPPPATGGHRRRETSACTGIPVLPAGSLDRCIRVGYNNGTASGGRVPAARPGETSRSRRPARRAVPETSSPASMWARCSNISFAPAPSSCARIACSIRSCSSGTAVVGSRPAEHADDQRGAGHQLAHHALKHPVAGDLGQNDVEMPREPDGVPPVAVPVAPASACQVLLEPAQVRARSPARRRGARSRARWRGARRRRRAPAPASAAPRRRRGWRAAPRSRAPPARRGSAGPGRGRRRTPRRAPPPTASSPAAGAARSPRHGFAERSRPRRAICRSCHRPCRAASFRATLRSRADSVGKLPASSSHAPLRIVHQAAKELLTIRRLHASICAIASNDIGSGEKIRCSDATF